MAHQGSQQKCGHDACTCLVQPDQSYCSEHCAQQSKGGKSAESSAGKHDAQGCGCGHPDCGGTRRA